MEKITNVEIKNNTTTPRVNVEPNVIARKPKDAPIRGDFSSRLLTWEQTCKYVNRGRTRTREFCDAIGATVKFGERCVRFDRTVIDAYLDKKAQAAVTDETA